MITIIIPIPYPKQTQKPDESVIEVIEAIFIQKLGVISVYILSKKRAKVLQAVNRLFDV